MKGAKPDLTALADNTLMQRVARGDTASFDTLFLRHYDRVYGILFRLVGNRAEAEDLVQEVFLRLHAHAANGRSRTDDNIAAWLYRVATNMGYNALRARKRQGERDMLLVPDSAGGPSAETVLLQRENERRVRATLARLSERQAQLLVLRQMGLSYAELAAVCEVAPGSVGTLLSRAAAAFRTEYSSQSDGGGEADARK